MSKLLQYVLLDESPQVLNFVGFFCRLILTDAVDPRETQSDTGSVTRADVDAVERDFKNEFLADFTHRTKSVDGVTAHPAIELQQLFVRKPKIGLADRYDLAAIPESECVIRIVGGPLPVAKLRIHENRVDQARITLPLEPGPFRPPRDVWAILPLEHNSFVTPLSPAAPPNGRKFFPRRKREDRGEVKTRLGIGSKPIFQTSTPLPQRQAADIHSAFK